jgi:hypothetical protein
LPTLPVSSSASQHHQSAPLETYFHSLPTVGKRLFNSSFRLFPNQTLDPACSHLLLSHYWLLLRRHHYNYFLYKSAFLFFKCAAVHDTPLINWPREKRNSLNLLWKLAVCFYFPFIIHIVCSVLFLSWTGWQLSVCFFLLPLLFFFLFSQLYCTYLGVYTVLFVCWLGNWAGGLCDWDGLGWDGNEGIEKTGRTIMGGRLSLLLGNTLGAGEGVRMDGCFITFRQLSSNKIHWHARGWQALLYFLHLDWCFWHWFLGLSGTATSRISNRCFLVILGCRCLIHVM